MSRPPENQLPQDSLGFVASEVLEVLNNVFMQAEIELPARQYIAVGGAGDTVHDCEQLTVSVEQMYSGLPGAQAQDLVRCDSPRTAVLVVELVRCVPSGVTSQRNARTIAPKPEDMNAYALTRMRDAWLLVDGLLTAADSFEFTGGMSDVSFGGPQGGYQGVIASLIVGIP